MVGWEAVVAKGLLGGQAGAPGEPSLYERR